MAEAICLNSLAFPQPLRSETGRAGAAAAGDQDALTPTTGSGWRSRKRIAYRSTGGRWGYYLSARGRIPRGPSPVEDSHNLNASAVAACKVVPRAATSIFICCSKSGSKRAENCVSVIAPPDVVADLYEVLGTRTRVACSMK